MLVVKDFQGGFYLNDHFYHALSFENVLKSKHETFDS